LCVCGVCVCVCGVCVCVVCVCVCVKERKKTLVSMPLYLKS